MKKNLWEIGNYYAGLIVIAAIFSMAYFVAHIEIKDLDLWLHLASGRYICEHGYVPLTDVFSHTVTGTYWNNHEWLFQVILYRIHHAWGWPGLTYMQVGVVFAALSLLFFLGYSRSRQLLTCFLLLLVYLVFQQRFTLRPDLFSLFFLSIYMYMLAYQLNKRWIIWILGAVQLLWTNMHGFFIFGPLIVFTTLISEWIKRHLPLPFEWNASARLSDAEYKRLAILFVSVCGVCVINPHFIEGALYPFRILFSVSGDQAVFFEHIQELQKPISETNLWQGSRFLYYKLLIILTGVSFFFNRRHIDINVLILWLMALIFSLNAMRNTVYFAFISYLVLLSNFLYFPFKDIVPLRFTNKKFRHITELFLKILLLIWMFHFTSQLLARRYYDFDKHAYKSEFDGLSLRAFPHKAVDFLVANKVQGNFFNDFNSGSYLIGRAYPDIRVFIDGRTELYGAQFFKDFYYRMWSEGDDTVLDERMETYQITGALLNSNRQHIPAKVLAYFHQNPEWVLVYFDFDGMIFLKDIPMHQDVIKQYAVSFKKWSTAFDLYAMRDRRAVPVEHLNRAYHLEAMDELDLAEQEAQTALLISPQAEEAYSVLAKVALKRKEYEKAYAYFRQAVVLNPEAQDMRFNMGLALLDMKAYDRAAAFFEDMRLRFPADVRPAFALVKVYALQEQYKKAVQLFEADLADRTADADTLYQLAVSYEALEQFDQAQKALEKAVQLKPDNKAYKKMLKLLK